MNRLELLGLYKGGRSGIVGKSRQVHDLSVPGMMKRQFKFSF